MHHPYSRMRGTKSPLNMSKSELLPGDPSDVTYLCYRDLELEYTCLLTPPLSLTPLPRRSVLLAVVFLAIGIVIGTFVDTSTLGFSEATGSEVENVDLTNEITTGDRRRVTEATAFGQVERHLLNPNTAYYDTISQLTVVKENG